MKAFRFSNGTVLETEAEVKAYTRGLEVARSNADKLDWLIEESHNVKAAGPKTEEELSQEAAAANDAPVEESVTEEQKPVETSEAA